MARMSQRAQSMSYVHKILHGDRSVCILLGDFEAAALDHALHKQRRNDNNGAVLKPTAEPAVAIKPARMEQFVSFFAK